MCENKSVQVVRLERQGTFEELNLDSKHPLCKSFWVSA